MPDRLYTAVAVDDLPRVTLVPLVERIREILWLDVDAWNPDKEWDADVAELIAAELEGAGLKPEPLAPAPEQRVNCLHAMLPVPPEDALVHAPWAIGDPAPASLPDVSAVDTFSCAEGLFVAWRGTVAQVDRAGAIRVFIRCCVCGVNGHEFLVGIGSGAWDRVYHPVTQAFLADISRNVYFCRDARCMAVYQGVESRVAALAPTPSEEVDRG